MRIIIAIILSLFIASITPSFALETTYTIKYDNNSNVIQDQNNYYEYNNFNQLAKVRETNSTGRLLEEYVYDHEGKRLKKVEYNTDGTNITTLYINENFIHVINSTGETYNETYYYNEGQLIAKKNNTGGKLFYHPDHLGSTNLVTDENGNVVEVTTYKPYGDVYEGGDSRYLFTGKERDKTGLDYFEQRYYSPGKFKHFTQPDTNIPDIYNPQDLNRFSYVRNNPYKYVDESGDVAWVPYAVAGIEIAVLGSVYAIGFSGVTYFEQIENIQKQKGVSYSEARQIVLSDPGLTKERQEAALAGFTFAAAESIVLRGLGKISQPTKGIDKSRYSKTTTSQTELPEAYITASQGGRHYGTYTTYLNKPTSQIGKGIRGYEKQIQIHQAKITNPSAYIKDWAKLSEKERQGLITYWQKEIRTRTEQRDVLRGILEKKSSQSSSRRSVGR